MMHGKPGHMMPAGGGKKSMDRMMAGRPTKRRDQTRTQTRKTSR